MKDEETGMTGEDGGRARAEPKSGGCSVVEDYDCKASDGLERTRAVCFSCGMFVCTNPGCSRVLTYLHYGRRRICTTCQEMHGLARKLP